jgi:hypothetical protein
MTWTTTYDSTLGMVEVILIGKVSGDDLLEASATAIALIRKKNATRGLINAADQIETSSVVELFDMPAYYADEGLSRDTRIALVVPKTPKLHDIAEFFETVCFNRGWVIQRFAGREEAVQWLTEDE